MRSASVLLNSACLHAFALASVLCSHARAAAAQDRTNDATGSLKAYNELRALAGVAVSAKLGTREPCAALAAAAALASIKVLPRESIIYAWGWTVILPLSLALTLIGRESKGIKDGAATRRVGAAFAAGAVSSVAGAFAAAKLLRPTLGAAANKAPRRSPRRTSAARRTSSWWPRPSGSKTMASSRRSRRRTSL